MTPKDSIDAGDHSVVTAKDAERDRKDHDHALKNAAMHLKHGAVHLKHGATTLKHFAIALKDRTLHLKDAALTLKRCTAAAKDRGNTLKVQRLYATVCSEPSKVWALNVADVVVTMKERGLTPCCAPHNVKVHDGDRLCSDFDLPGGS